MIWKREKVKITVAGRTFSQVGENSVAQVDFLLRLFGTIFHRYDVLYSFSCQLLEMLLQCIDFHCFLIGFKIVVPTGTITGLCKMMLFPLQKLLIINYQLSIKMKMSFFTAPIAPQKDAGGKVLRPATLKPYAEVDVAQLHQYITTNEELHALTDAVRAAPDMREAKARLLPYVLPCGTFSYRNRDSLVKPSGLLPIDVDHLPSHEEAVELRQRLFDDPMLRPVLCFISPSGLGVKAFVPYTLPPEGTEDVNAYVCEQINWAMQYVNRLYGGQHVDTSGKDLARACFLCHDADALCRFTTD